MTTPNAPESGQQRLLTQAIAERRATPAFDGSPVPDEVLSAILRAGLEAPSGYNLQRSVLESGANFHHSRHTAAHADRTVRAAQVAREMSRREGV